MISITAVLIRLALSDHWGSTVSIAVDKYPYTSGRSPQAVELIRLPHSGLGGSRISITAVLIRLTVSDHWGSTISIVVAQ